MALTLRKGGSSTAGRSSTLQYEVFLKARPRDTFDAVDAGL